MILARVAVLCRRACSFLLFRQLADVHIFTLACALSFNSTFTYTVWKAELYLYSSKEDNEKIYTIVKSTTMQNFLLEYVLLLLNSLLPGETISTDASGCRLANNNLTQSTNG